MIGAVPATVAATSCRAWILTAVTLLLVLVVPGIARAAEITVTGTDDEISENGACSLREAVIAANTDSAFEDCPAGSGADTIILPAGRYRLFIPGNEESGSASSVVPSVKDLDVTEELTIRGAGPEGTIIDANELDRAIDAYAPLTIADLSIVNGRTEDSGRYEYNSGDGAAIRSDSPLVVEDCVFADNHAARGLNGAAATGSGGQVPAFGEAARAGADGGAIYALGPLTVSDSRFEGNSAGAGGTGGDATGGKATSNTDSEINGGGALSGVGGTGGTGGAIWAQEGLTVTDTTFRENASGAGGSAGTATGGQAGIGYDEQANELYGGNGGVALGGVGGEGGDGAAIYVAAGSGEIISSWFEGNTSGAGGTGGAAIGGKGVPLTRSEAGNGTGGEGGMGGSGAAIATDTHAGVLTVDAATMDGDSSGAGGAGGPGKGADSEESEFGFSYPANGTGGMGGNGGNGGAGAFASGARLTNVTLHADSSGTGGSGGSGTAGKVTGGVADPPQGTGGRAGNGGAGGAVANVTTGTQTEVRSSTLTDDTTGGAAAPGAGTTRGGAAGSAGAGRTLAIVAGRISLGSSILEGPGPACSGTIEDHGANLNRNVLGGDTSCPGEPGDAELGELTDNGGPVPTQRPDPLGPAIDRAPAGECPATDARFVDRPSGSDCDIGAYQVAAPQSTTGEATEIVASGGTLTAVVDPQAAGGVVHFEYGTTTGYGSRSPDQDLEPAAEDLDVSAPVTGFALGTVVHYRVSITTPDGSAVGADQTFTTGHSAAERSAEAAAAKAAAEKAAAERTPPYLSDVSIGSKRFAVSDKPTAIAAVRRAPTARPPRVPQGTTFKLTSSKAATFTFVIARRTLIHRHGHKKVRFRSVGNLTRALTSGPSSVPFSGRIGRKALKPGRYQVQISGTDAGGNRSNTATLEFSIVQG